MRLVAFFVYVLFLLLGGGDHAYAAAMPHGKIRHERQVRKAIRHDRAHLHNAAHSRFHDVTVDREDEYLVSNEVEDDDNGGNQFAKKYRLPATGYAVYAHHHAVFDTPQNTFLVSPSFNGPVAHIFILQRNIRI